MADENNNQQPSGSFDPNAASYVPNSPEYQAAQEAAAAAPAPAPAQQQPASFNPYAQPAAPQQQPPAAAPQNPYAQAPQVNPYGQQPPSTVPASAPAGQEPPSVAPEGAPAGQVPPSAAPQGAPQNPYGAPAGYQPPAASQPPYGYTNPNGQVPPAQIPYQQPQPKDHATSSLVLGVLSIIAAFVSPLIAFILGGIGLTFASQDKQAFGPEHSKAGRITSIVGIVIGVLSWVVSILLVLVVGL